METTKEEFLNEIKKSRDNSDKAAVLEGVLVEAFADALEVTEHYTGEPRAMALTALGTIGNALLNHYKR